MSRAAVAVLTSLLFAVCLAGCGGDSDNATSASENNQAPRSKAETDRARFYEHVRKAGRARRASDWPLAVEHLEAALAARPDHEASLVDLAVALKKLGRRDDAIAVLERLRKEHPQLPRSHVLLADVLAEGSDPKPAELARSEKLYRHALEMEPNVAGPRIGLARVLLHNGQAADAEGEFRTVLGIDAKSIEALTGLADALIARGQPRDAVPPALRAIAAGTKATGRADIPSEMDTVQSFKDGTLRSEKVRPALRALRRVKKALGAWPEAVPADVRKAADALR